MTTQQSSNAQTDDADLAALRALAQVPLDVDATEAARLRRRALGELDAAHGSTFGALGSRVAHLWSRFGVPVVLASVAGVYLTWAVQATAAIYR